MLKEMEQQGIQDAAFQEFHKKLAKFFPRFFGQQIRLQDDEKISLLLIVINLKSNVLFLRSLPTNIFEPIMN